MNQVLVYMISGPEAHSNTSRRRVWAARSLTVLVNDLVYPNSKVRDYPWTAQPQENTGVIQFPLIGYRIYPVGSRPKGLPLDDFAP